MLLLLLGLLLILIDQILGGDDRPQVPIDLIARTPYVLVQQFLVIARRRSIIVVLFRTLGIPLAQNVVIADGSIVLLALLWQDVQLEIAEVLLVLQLLLRLPVYELVLVLLE